MKKPAKQSGVMLLEVLISLLLFAIGILGMVGMQAMAMRLTADAKYRAEAATYADQLLGQMWADDIKTLSTNYATGQSKYTAWKSQIQASNGLPGASLSGNEPTVAIDANNVVTISIHWQGPDEQAAHHYVTVARLNS